MKVTLRTMLYSLNILFHPFDTFWNLKHHKQNTLQAANYLLALHCFLSILSIQLSGFLFTYSLPENRNTMMDIISIVLPILIWTVLNWALSTLLNGKGTMKQIWITTIYAFTPYTLAIIPGIIMSNLITADEGMFYSVLMNGSYYWSLILVVLGSMVIHDYTISKTILITVFTLLGISAVLLIFVIFFSTFQQLMIFINTVFSEFKYRI